LVFYIETRLRSMIQIKVEIFHVANISPCSKQFAPRCTKKEEEVASPLSTVLRFSLYRLFAHLGKLLIDFVTLPGILCRLFKELVRGIRELLFQGSITNFAHQEVLKVCFGLL